MHDPPYGLPGNRQTGIHLDQLQLGNQIGWKTESPRFTATYRRQGSSGDSLETEPTPKIHGFAEHLTASKLVGFWGLLFTARRCPMGKVFIRSAGLTLSACASLRTANRWVSAAANWNTALIQALLDSANLRQSDLVVDIAAGSGDPALSIAGRLRNGSVFAMEADLVLAYC
jgi:hypothetical protein